MRQDLDDIRALVDPQGYMDALRQAREQLVKNLGLVLADYDLTAASPTVQNREALLEQLHRTLDDLKWRIEEIDRRLNGVATALNGHQPNRAERRVRS